MVATIPSHYPPFAIAPAPNRYGALRQNRGRMEMLRCVK